MDQIKVTHVSWPSPRPFGPIPCDIDFKFFANFSKLRGSVGFSFKINFPLSIHVTKLISEDVEFYYASFDLCEKFDGGGQPIQTPTQMLKSVFSMFGFQEIGSSWVSFQIIFAALQSELIWANPI